MKQSLLMSAIDNISPTTRKVAQAQEQLEKQLADTAKQAKATSNLLSKTEKYEKQTSAVKKAQTQFNTFNAALKAYKAELKGVENPTAKQIEKLGSLERKAVSAEIALRDKSRALNTLESDLAAASIDTNRLADAQDRLRRKSDKYTKEVKEQRQALRELSKAQKDAASQKAGEFNAGGALALTGAVAAGGITAMDAQQAKIHFENNSSMSATEKDAVNKQVLDFKASREGSAFSIPELYDAIAGAKSDKEASATLELMSTMRKSVSEEKFSNQELISRVKELQMLGFSNKEIKSNQAMLNKYYKGHDMNDAYDGLKEVAALAETKGFDKSMAQASVIAFMNSGRTGSNAGSAVENTIERLTLGNDHASKDQQKAANLLGMDNDKISSMVQDDFAGFLEHVNKRLGKVSQGEKTFIMDQLFGSDFLIWQKVIEDGSLAKINAETQQTEQNAAQLDQNADNMNDSSRAGLDALLGSLQRLAVVIGDDLEPAFNWLADTVTNGVNAVADYFEQASSLKTGLILAAGGALMLVRTFKAAASILTGSMARLAGGGIAGGATAGKAAGKMGAKKLGGKLLSAIPIIGTAFTIADIASTALSGKDLIDHISGWFGKDDDETEIKKPELNADLKAENLEAGVKVANTGDELTSIRGEQNKTININCDVSGEVKGATPEQQEKFFSETKERIIQEFQSGDMREGYA